MITTVRGARGSGKTLRNRSDRRDCSSLKVASSGADHGSGVAIDVAASLTFGAPRMSSPCARG
jgi:hypothetical protein